MTRNGRFNDRCLSLDEFAGSFDSGKSRIFSDRGEGAERICRACRARFARVQIMPVRMDRTYTPTASRGSCSSGPVIPAGSRMYSSRTSRKKQ